jgi:molybdate transport system substrate-binding protein
LPFISARDYTAVREEACMSRLFVWCFVLILAMAPSARAEAPLRVSAAISLKDALEEIVKAYEAGTGAKVELNLGASGQLMAQIRDGAPIDLFISAGQKQVNDLVHSGRAVEASRTIIAKNSLVLIVPSDQKDAVKSFADLTHASVKRISIGQPRTVPAGEYAMQVLMSLKIDEAVKDRLVFGANVRQVLDYVARGEVEAGLVYKTDAMQAAKDVRVVATAKDEDHKPIEYPAVVIKDSANADAAAKFLKYLAGKDAQASLKKYGFALPEAGSTTPGAHPSTPATAP